VKKLSKLFHLCAYDIKYKSIGNHVNYAFLEEDDTLYIFFQGSVETIDWFRNFFFFKTKKKPYKEMQISYKVHRGFLEAWKEVEDLIINKICEDDDKGNHRWKEINVVGYSHGGALAAFCHECVWYWRPDLRENNLHGYGFEAPRIYGCYHVKKELKERWKNFLVIRTNNDLVTHCPPFILGYTHVGNMLKIKGDTSLVDNKQPKCIKSHYPQVVLDALLKKENESN